ncbi:Helix-loop-helix protein 4 [Caenorhabditis elegans]|uniref:Helix-loop-helix protein 4 n=1 Tax=Caenorhabditis elegans TaxID=6239 RepID=HLH4_CAEEL|nr:Helix-loop-helix protein 4 [Caenorhabditis elegans]P34555.1 RecName: Full=Helix-loop-helix protein 4 [Caenorhabditis elegans]CAA81589.1 Helix-loop-helix protein 4 [Caenorhabditis elegans]|eukprot:NP_499150.1 Helix-loop-helix protein 4 [Caenorhabditis elegans]
MPMVVAKRNARERTRVHTVNQAFLVLKQHLPSLRQFTKRVSKLRILNAAITYIDTLLKLIQSSEAVPQSVISATLGPIVPTPVRAVHKISKPDTVISQPIRPLAPVLPRHETYLPAPIAATCAPDHSLVDYRSTFASSLAPPVPMQMPSVFSPQPTFPYMKSLLDYPTYFYQPSTAPPPPPAPTAPQSHLIVNNQLVPMPSYQCF